MITTTKIEDREIAFVLMPDDSKRRSIGKFCKDSEVRCQLISLDGKPYLNWHNINESKTSASRGYSGVIYNEKLPEGDWQLIGLSQSITEEQAAGIVEKANDELIDIHDCHWRDYMSDSWEKSFSTAKRSFLSLMESLRLYHKNPELDMSHWKDKLAIPSREALVNYNKWSEAQSRTGNYAVLVRELENQ